MVDRIARDGIPIPTGSADFLHNTKFKNNPRRSGQAKAETRLAKLRELSVALAESMTDSLDAATQSTDQNELPWSNALSSFHTFVSGVEKLTQQPLVDDTFDSKFGRALATVFNRDALIVDAQTSIQPTTVQNNESTVDSNQIGTTPGTLFTPINLLMARRSSGLVAAVPAVSGSDLNALVKISTETTTNHTQSKSPQTRSPSRSVKHCRTEIPRASPRKRPASEGPLLAPGSGDTGPSLKRQKREAPTPNVLIKQLISDAAARISGHVRAWKDHPALPAAWDNGKDAKAQIRELWDLASSWEELTDFDRLVSLILRVECLQRLETESNETFYFENKSEPRLAKKTIDRVFPELLPGPKSAAIRTWLSRSRRLKDIKDYLPFLPENMRVYERASKGFISQICNLLTNDRRAQDLAKVGRAFGNHILRREAFVWADLTLSSREISNLTDETLLHLLTIRYSSVGTQCELCDGEECRLFDPSQYSVSRPSIPAPRDVSWGRAPPTSQYNKITGEGCNMEPPTSSSIFRPLQSENTSSLALTSWSDTTWDHPNVGLQLPSPLPNVADADDCFEFPSHLAHWQQIPPSELLTVANIVPETVVRTTTHGSARQRCNSVLETRRGTVQVHPPALGEIETQSETSSTLQILSEGQVQQLSQITSQNPDASSERKAFGPTIFCGLHDPNTAWSQSFVHRVVRTRTLLNTSSYELVLPMSMQCDHVRTAIRLVVSLYTQTSVSLRHNAASLFADGMKQTKDKPEQALAILLLYVHYCVVHQVKWAAASQFLAYQQKRGIRLERYPLALFTIYECILNIFNKSPMAHGGLGIAWLQQVQNSYQVLDLGLCPRLLFFIGRITELALQPSPDFHESKQILLETEQLQQIVCGADEEASLVASQIATTYQLSAQLLAYIRLFGYTPNCEDVRLKVSELAKLLFQLPTESSPLHRAMDPLFSVVVCFCLICDDAVANGLMDRSLGLRRGMTSNVSLAMEAAGWIRRWIKTSVSGTVQHGWFESLRKAFPQQYSNMSLG